MSNPKDTIVNILKKARNDIPDKLVPDLPPTRLTDGQPDWHDFEYTLWGHGENIRSILKKNTKFRKDGEILSFIMEIINNKNAKRGRQSFIMLLGYSCCSHLASQLVSHLNDPGINGHIILTISKTKNPNFVKEISPFQSNEFTWVRNVAKKYVSRYVGS